MNIFLNEMQKKNVLEAFAYCFVQWRLEILSNFCGNKFLWYKWFYQNKWKFALIFSNSTKDGDQFSTVFDGTLNFVIKANSTSTDTATRIEDERMKKMV